MTAPRAGSRWRGLIGDLEGGPAVSFSPGMAAIADADSATTSIGGHSDLLATGDVHGHVSPEVLRDAVRTFGDVHARSRRADAGQFAAKAGQGRSWSP